MYELYATKGTIAEAAALTLAEAGVDWTPRKVDFGKSEQTSEDYLSVNPKGRVPSLVTPHGILTETGAIQHFIAESHPDANLIPDDTFKAAKMREIMFYIASTLHVNHAHKMRGHRWADQESSHADMTAKVQETMTASCAYVEEFIEGPYVLGDKICLADPYLYVGCRWAKVDGVNLADFPKVSAFFEAYSNRPSVSAVRAHGLI